MGKDVIRLVCRICYEIMIRTLCHETDLVKHVIRLVLEYYKTLLAWEVVCYKIWGIVDTMLEIMLYDLGYIFCTNWDMMLQDVGWEAML